MSERRRLCITKRACIALMLLLVAGAIVNVAVAWGCAIWADETDGTLLGDATIDSMLLASVAEDGERFHHRSGTEGSGAGVRRVVVAAIGKDGNRFYGYHLVRAGFPMRAMCGELAVASTTSDSPWGSTWAIRLSPRIQEAISGFAPGIVPLRPIWPGFAINTVFYAFILWVVFAAPFALRRRRRIKRGLCPKCTYPRGAGTNDVCTECGAAHPHALAR